MLGSDPWTMLGIADAPSLCTSLNYPDSCASQWFAMCPRWQDRLLKIRRAKRISQMMENGEEIPDMNDDGQVDEFDVVHLDKDTKRNAKEIRYDLNPNVSQLIIVDCVMESNGRAKQCDDSAKLKLEAILQKHQQLRKIYF